MTKSFIFTIASVFIIAFTLGKGASNNKQCTAVSVNSINELNQNKNKKVKDFADNSFEENDEEIVVIRARRSAKPDPRRGSTSRLGRTTRYNSGSSSGSSSSNRGGGGSFYIDYIIFGGIFVLTAFCIAVFCCYKLFWN